MLLYVQRKAISDYRFDLCFYFRVAQLGFGLPFKLGFNKLDTDDGC